MPVNFKEAEFRKWSQHGEDGVLKRIFEIVTPRNKQFIEIGAHFHEANCLRLQHEDGWHGVYFDDFHDFPPLGFRRQWITAENINAELSGITGLDPHFDVLSIDIDGIDFYLWHSLDAKWTPTVVVVEYMSQLGMADKVIPYDPQFRCDGTLYWGASAVAWMNLAAHKGYSLVYIEQTATNMFFVKNDCLPVGIFPNVNNLVTLLAHTDPMHGLPPDKLNREWCTSRSIIDSNWSVETYLEK